MSAFQKWINKEKNTRIRERNEAAIQKDSAILLAILLAGNVYGTAKDIYGAFVFIISTLILFFLYVLIEWYIWKPYAEYTNQLIRQETKRKT